MRYISAVAATVVAILLRYAVDPVLGNQFPFVTFFLAVLVAGWYGGFGPAIVAIVLGTLATSWLFIPPRGLLTITGTANFVGSLIYVVVGLAMALLTQSQRRQRQRAQANARLAEEHLGRLQREVAQRKRFEQRLSTSEARFRAVVEGAPVAIIALDQEGRIRMANHSATRLFGYEREEMLDQTLDLFVPEKYQEIHAGHRSGHFETPQIRVLEEDHGLRGRRSDGSEFPIEVAVNYVPTGEDMLALAFITNITERQKRREALKESEARFRIMANSAPVMIWVAGSNGKRSFFNEPWLAFTGQSMDDELGDGWTREVHADDLEACLQTYRKAFERRERFEIEYRLRRADGEYRWVLDTGIPRFSGSGALQGYIGSAIDIHERKHAEAIQSFLAEASDILASSLDYTTTLRHVAELAVPRIADWCAIDLVAGDNIERVAIAHADPAKVELAEEYRRRFPPRLESEGGVAQVMRTGQPELYWQIGQEQIDALEDEGLRDMLTSLGLRSLLAVPLAVGGRVLGALTLVTSESGRLFDQADLRLAEELARRAALAVDNAQLYHDVNEQREHLHVTLSSISDAVIATDAAGTVTFMNDIARSLTAWHGEEAIGQPVDDVLPLLDEETGEPLASPVSRVLSGGQVVEIPEHALLVTRDGRRIPIDDSGAPIRDALGQIIGAVLVFRDITSRRESRRQLEESLDRTRDLYEISRQISGLRTPQEILEPLLQSRYLQGVSRASILVFDHPWEDRPPRSIELVANWTLDSREDRVGEQYAFADYELANLYSSSDPVVVANVQTDPRLANPLKELLAQLNTYSMISYPLIAAGEWYGILSLHWSQPYSAEERVTRHIRGLADQIAAAVYNSRLLESEAEARRVAEEANLLKLKFLAMVSHELRTPLTSIQGFASTLLADDIEWDADSQRDFIRIINEESDKLTDLIEQLLDLSRLEAGMLAITPEPRQVHQVLQTALPQLSVLAASHRLTIDVPSRLPPILADEHRIGQVLSNLVSNAARYAPPDTVIRISASREHGAVRFEVSDQGPGIPPEDRLQVFEAFRQARNRPGTKSEKGAGLGLAIARGLVEAHGGRIWIGDGPDDGTTVCFTLPTYREETIELEVKRDS